MKTKFNKIQKKTFYLNYKENDEVETLPCFHIFHGLCIEEWFNNNNNICPVCKNDISNDNDIELN